jgi:two-component system NarL family sensor kinase
MRQSEPLSTSVLAGAPLDAAGAIRSASARVARVWAAIAVALMLLNLVLAVRYVAITGDATGFLSHQLLLPLSTVVYALLGVAVITHQPANPIGWLFLVTGTAYAFTALSAGIIAYGSTLPAAMSPALADLALWLGNWIWLPATILPTTFVFLLFPDGRLPSPRWRPVAWAVGLGMALIAVGLALYPGPVESWGTGPNPYALAGADAALDLLITAGSALLLIGGIGSILAILFRYRLSRGIERQQMKWLAYVAAIIVIFMFVTVPVWLTGGLSDPVAMEVNIALTNMVMLLIGIAAAVAIVGYHLYDIDIIINRTLVYGVMTGIILFIYTLVVGAASILFGAQGSRLLSLVATGLVAVLFQPIRNRLQRGVNRLLYGQRDEPFEVMARLGQRLEQTITPDSAYPTIVETVAQAMRLPYAAIQIPCDGQRRTVDSYGIPGKDLVSYDLTHQGELVGWLQVGHRAPDEALNPADERLLRNIARQAGAAVHNAQLTADLQRSRQQIITSREEERRRLRRDLHDGLGPSLASLLLEARVLRRMLRDDQDAAEKLADEMQADIRTTIEDIRRVVHELRPPALDDLGLAAAVQVMAAKIGREENQGNGAVGGLRVEVDAPGDLLQLPAAVEVAAYRIIQEALTNVVHHAQAACAVVRLRLDRQLLIEVADDGVGITGGRVGGMGLRSMRERAAELGGSFSIEPASGGGTIIRAALPTGQG